MKMIRYIVVVVAVLLVWSCSYPDMELNGPVGRDGLIQFVPRVMPFGQIDTKANKTAEEQKVTSMAMAIFDASGKCIYFQYSTGSNPSFLVDPETLENSNPGRDLTSCSVYAFANIPQLAGLSQAEWKDRSLSYFTDIDTDVTGVLIPSDGFPMMGGRTGVNLDTDGELQYLISLELYCAYAKITVNMSVSSPLDMPSSHSSYFIPSTWEVHNVASSVDFVSNVETSASVLDKAFSYSVFKGLQATSSSVVSFSLYLPERLLEPAKENSFVYPFVSENGGVLRPEDEHLRQRYKPDLVSDTQKATYVSISGRFVNHQGHGKNVTYDLYVGENNYNDFNIRRNIEYTNNVTIRSATNYSDPAISNEVSYDGRVTVGEELPYKVKIERETLLDAHFEVRPLRVSVNSGYKVKVSIKNPDATPWIRMEKTASKRQYFTTDLLTEIKGNVQYEVGSGDSCIWLYVDENTAGLRDGYRTAVITLTCYDQSGNAVGNPVDYTIAQRYLYPVVYGDRTYSIEYHEEYLHNYDSEDRYGQTEFEGMPWGLENNALSKKNKAIVFDTGEGWVSNIIDAFINSNVGKVSPYYDFYLPRDIGSNKALTARAYSGHTFVSEIIGTMKESDNDFGKITLSDEPGSAIEYCYNKNKRNASGEVETMNWYLPAIDEMEEIAIGGYETFDEFQNKYYWSCQPSYIQNRAHYHNLADEKGTYYTDDYGFYYVQKGEGKVSTKQEYDGSGYARATKVNFVNGEYTWASSGVSGYQDIFEIPGSGDPKVYVVPNKYSYSFWFSTRTFQETQTLQRDEGNQPRTKQNRIRCVYKNTTAATQ